MASSRLGILYGGSLLLHAGVALAIVSIHPPQQHEATSITMSESKRKTEEKKPEPPPPPPPMPPSRAERHATKAPPAPEPVKVAEPPPTAAAATNEAPVADFGLSLSGGVGPGGIAVPVGNGAPRPATRVIKAAAPKALVAVKEPQGDACLEALIKPKPLLVPQPVYADRAREAGISGKVRVELTVDETGQVIATRVIEGLGYGLDEAALDAAKAAKFEPATLCGKPTKTTFVIGIRFSL